MLCPNFIGQSKNSWVVQDTKGVEVKDEDQVMDGADLTVSAASPELDPPHKVQVERDDPSSRYNVLTLEGM